MMARNAGPSDSTASLNGFGGIISRRLDEGLTSDTVFLRSFIDIGLKQFSTSKDGRGR